MRRAFLALMIVFLLAAGTSAWGVCPDKDPNDPGECDSLILEPWDNMDTISVFPAFYRVMILVTTDLTSSEDSLGNFLIPLTYTSSNPAVYCSVSAYWNQTTCNIFSSKMPRSIFRHLPNVDEPEIHNRMLDMQADESERNWDFVQLDLQDGVSSFWFVTVPTGDQDQWWWEGDRVLLVTITFLLEDTTTICIDTTFWSPTGGSMLWVTRAGDEFVPRDNLRRCFKKNGDDVREIPNSEDSRPSEFSLSQNYPNPFNPVTNIGFTVLKTANVKMEVFNIVGQKVITLVDEEMTPGTYAVDWDGKDESGKAVSSGIYFYRMQADEFTDMKKMLLVK